MIELQRCARRSVIVAAILFLLATAVDAPAGAESSVRWTYSYEDALKTAAREGKPVMAFFYTNWCGWCKKLDETTYADSAVVAASESFVCLKVDCEKLRDVAYGYGVKSLPSIFFLDPSGRVIWREFGYRDAAYLARRMEEVVAFYKAARAAEPFIRKAFDAAGRGRTDEAIAILDGAVASYPNDARLYAARGALYRQKRDPDAAMRDFDASLSLNPADDSVLVMRGMAWYEKRDPEKAMADYNKAIGLNRWAYDAYFGRGIVYLDIKDADLAIKNFNAVTLINPRHPAAYLYRGVAYLMKSEFDKSISDLTMAIAISPAALNAYANRAAAYMYAGQYDRSWEDVATLERRGYRMNPEFISELQKRSGRER